jgi:FixJ family two-component response regulator
VLHEAKVSPRQHVICEKRFVDGLMNYQIGMEMNISDKTVERDVAAVYESVLRVLKSRIKRSPLGVRFYIVRPKGLFFML